jgi:beta-1,4-mannooligosaccharide/beta-1,4-mannosyl-N-acetylglucosamine phosphorylase
MTDLFRRHPGNPILTAADWPYPANAVFNPAATRVGDETVILARVEDRRGISHLTVARSANGLDGWSVDPEALLAPQDGLHDEQWGFEDPRIVRLDELDCWAITCTAYGPPGPAVYLATTSDFRTLDRRGIIMHPEDKNAALLPRRIDGKWVLFHRPLTAHGGQHGGIVISRSNDLRDWSAPERVMQPRLGAWWDAVRIGIGPPPLETGHGWLILYHGVKDTVSGTVYRVGAALAAVDEPALVTHRLDDWLISPCEPYERTGDVPNTVFPCGLVLDGDEIRLYYGGADTTINIATASLQAVLALLLEAGVPATDVDAGPGTA